MIKTRVVLAVALALGVAAAAGADGKGRAFEWTTSSAEAKQMLKELQLRIENFQQGPENRKLAEKMMEGINVGFLGDVEIWKNKSKVENPLLCEEDGTQPQLYDVLADPNEKQDVAKDNPKIVKDLTAQVVAWRKQMPQPPLGDWVQPPKGAKEE